MKDYMIIDLDRVEVVALMETAEQAEAWGDASGINYDIAEGCTELEHRYTKKELQQMMKAFQLSYTQRNTKGEMAAAIFVEASVKDKKHLKATKEDIKRFESGKNTLRPGTKLEAMYSALPGTIDELVEATGWQPQSVRGAFYDLKKHGIVVVKSEDEIYHEA